MATQDPTSHAPVYCWKDVPSEQVNPDLTRRLITGLRLAQGDTGWSEVPARSSKPCSWCRYHRPGPAPTRAGCPGVKPP